MPSMIQSWVGRSGDDRTGSKMDDGSVLLAVDGVFFLGFEFSSFPGAPVPGDFIYRPNLRLSAAPSRFVWGICIFVSSRDRLTYPLWSDQGPPRGGLDTRAGVHTDVEPVGGGGKFVLQFHGEPRQSTWLTYKSRSVRRSDPQPVCAPAESEPIGIVQRLAGRHSLQSCRRPGRLGDGASAHSPRR
jgi:hypothetical protein